MIKGLTHQEDILKVHVPNRDSKYMKQKTLGWKEKQENPQL